MRWPWAFTVLLVISCRNDDDDARSIEARLCEPTSPVNLHAYSDASRPLPASLVSSSSGTVIFTDNTPATNPITNAGAALGRMLFYDPRLSANNRVSCGSCHIQAFGFGDTARVSRGVHASPSRRRTMALANVRFYAYDRFFWDERDSTLESQVLVPIQSAEMGSASIDRIVTKIRAAPSYPPLFAAAFGSPVATRELVAAALSQFVRSLVSADSPFDAVYATGGAPDPSRLTASQLDGFRLFNSVGCANCHRTAAQVADQASNIGLDLVSMDSGAGGGRFKPASLRNIAVRPPYMHDGRFATLDAVVDFYASDVRDAQALDPRLRGSDGTPRRLPLDSKQRADLVAFLESLTDTAFLRAERFSSPFRCAAR